MTVRIATVLFFVFTGLIGKAQQSHSIEITIEGAPNTSFYLAYYFNENTYIRDSVKTDANGYMKIAGDEKLDPGIYILVKSQEKQKMFDFPIYDDQEFSLSTVAADPYREMKTEGDINNELFFRNLIFNATQNQKASTYNQILQDPQASEEEKGEARESLRKINDDVNAFQDNIIEEHPNTLVAKILSARKTVKVPDFDASTGVDSTYQYYYFKNHYWDGIDLAEPALLKMPFPLFAQKMDEFFDKVVVQNPDTLIAHIDEIVSQSKPHEETYRFVVWSLTTKYYSPQIMGLDKVFVHISDTYFSSGEMDFWADEQLKKNITDRAAQLRLSMLGMKAPNLIMQDVSKKAQSMYDISANYTVLYFYDPDCGHCKKETPVLVDFMKNTSFDVQVYSICADTSMTKMSNYIAEMDMKGFVNVNGPRTYVGSYQELYDAFQTPTLYVLDEKKKIIAKKLPAEKLEEFLQRHSSLLRRKEGED